MMLQFESLKSDFAYNLDLLRQRDEELAAYDAQQVRLCAFLHTALHSRRYGHVVQV